MMEEPICNTMPLVTAQRSRDSWSPGLAQKQPVSSAPTLKDS
jgi:hypothetical protein